MLKIDNLHVSVSGKAILKGLSLTVNAGEVHAIMGPNGAGKSTLAYVIAGRDAYEVTEGSITYNGQDLLSLEPHLRARAGIFLGFQYPVEIPGVSNLNFMRTALNAVRTQRGEPELGGSDFIKYARQHADSLGVSMDMMKRFVNVGFSGGEKKRNEMVQMALLNPSLMLLDETDSGLDIDALKMVSSGINYARGPDKATILITHYQRLLEYVAPDYIHVLQDGRIVRTGDKSLALELERTGYGLQAA